MSAKQSQAFFNQGEYQKIANPAPKQNIFVSHLRSKRIRITYFVKIKSHKTLFPYFCTDAHKDYPLTINIS